MDVAIIGGGTAGLFSAYCCKNQGLSYAVFESLPYVGGQCIAFYSDKIVHSVPGCHNLSANEFIRKLSEQCGLENLYLNTSVTIADCGDTFSIVTNNNLQFNVKYVIIATGIGIMEPFIPLGIKGIDTLVNTSDFVQSYCLNTELYKNKNVVIAGGGNSAADYALHISKIAKSVTLLHKREKFRCDESKLNELKKNEFNNIYFKLNQQILEVQDGIIFTDKEVITADKIVFCYGLHVNTNSINNISSLDLEMEQNLIKCNLPTMKTSKNRCYAVGDVVSYPEKKRNILSSCFEAQMAVHAIVGDMGGNYEQ